MLKKSIVISFLVLLGLLTTGYFAVWRPFQYAGKQIADLERIRFVARVAYQYQKDHGSYPRSLAPITHPDWLLIDSWGHPVYYLSDGTMFIVATYGRDGKPDGLDFKRLRETSAQAQKVCGNWNADQVMSDKGEHRICGK